LALLVENSGHLKTGIGFLFLFLFFISGCGKDAEPENTSYPYIEKGWKFTSNGLWVKEEVTELKTLKTGPFIRLPDRSLLTAESKNCLISNDINGISWSSYPVFKEPAKYSIGEKAIIRTKNGTIIIAFYNPAELANWNWQTSIHDSPGAILPTYTVRSLDGGKTWQDPVKLHDDWTGAIRDIIETAEGNIVFTSMMMLHNPGRHSVLTYTSKDDGLSWQRSNIIDLGGIGHHGGVTEATIEQLKDGRIWMLMRTNWKFFWEAYSDDEGLTWKDFKATDIDASSAPGQLFRMQSGRLVLVWNRYYPEGQNTYPLTGGDNNWSEVPVSNHREQLSVMFSDNDGGNWTTSSTFAKISVIEKLKGTNTWISYPYLFESEPGVLWVTTGQGNLRVSIKEQNYIQ
jgi:sialidase-1